MYDKEPEITDAEEQELLGLLDEEEFQLPPLPPDFVSNVLARLGISPETSEEMPLQLSGEVKLYTDAYWMESARRLLRSIIESLIVSGELVTVNNINRAIDSLPYVHPQTGKCVWPDDSLVLQCLTKAIRQQNAGMPLPSATDPITLQSYFEHELARPGTDRQRAGILSTLAELSLYEQTVYQLRMQGYSTKQVADELGRPPSAIRQAHRRAFSKLRRIIEKTKTSTLED